MPALGAISVGERQEFVIHPSVVNLAKRLGANDKFLETICHYRKSELDSLTSNKREIDCVRTYIATHSIPLELLIQGLEERLHLLREEQEEKK